MTVVETLLSLSRVEAYFFNATCALITHFIFNKYEPSAPIPLLLFLGILPFLSSLAILPHSSSLAPALLTGYVIYYATLLLSIALYRVSPLHPLANYPGPILCKLSKLWGVWISSTGKTHVVLQELHDQYGPYVRIGPNEISVRDKAALGPLVGLDGLPKGPIWEGRRARGSPPALIGIRSNPIHLQHRKVWNMGFTSTAVKVYEVTLESRVDILIDELEKRCQVKDGKRSEGIVDMAHWMGCMAADLMGDIGFGGGFELMREGDVDSVWYMIEHGMKPPAILQHLPVIGSYIMASPLAAKATKRLREFAFRRTLLRMNAGSQKPDLMHHFLYEDSPKPPKADIPSLCQDGLLVVIAGADTTATVMSNVWYFLLSEPDAYKRLRNELDQAFPPSDGDSGFDANKLADLAFLNAVINESMRLYPPVPVNVQRYVERGTGGKLVADRFIPEGTAVTVPPYAVHRDPSNFHPFPDTFIPDRWLKSASGNDRAAPTFHTDHAAFMPFSLGPMNCAGKNMALLEMRVVISTVVRKFDMRFANGYNPDKWEQELNDYLVFSKGKLPVVLAPRRA